jgi:mRNA interferase MazF
MIAKARGQVWWANLPDPLGWRPVLILTRDDALPKLHYATVAPLSRTIRGTDSEVVLEVGDGVPTRSAVTLDNIFTIEQDLLVGFLVSLPADRMNEVWEALHFALDLPF